MHLVNDCHHTTTDTSLPVEHTSRSTDSEYLGTVATEMTSLAATNNVFEGEGGHTPHLTFKQNAQSKTAEIQRRGMRPSSVLWMLRKTNLRRMSWVQSQPNTSSLGRVKSHVGWSISPQRRWNINTLKYTSFYQILHGDLAARNMLLCEGNIVKICDFGLSKILAQGGGSYTKKSDTPLPVKWLALETLNYR